MHAILRPQQHSHCLPYNLFCSPSQIIFQGSAQPALSRPATHTCPLTVSCPVHFSMFFSLPASCRVFSYWSRPHVHAFFFSPPPASPPPPSSSHWGIPATGMRHRRCRLTPSLSFSEAASQPAHSARFSYIAAEASLHEKMVLSFGFQPVFASEFPQKTFLYFPSLPRAPSAIRFDFSFIS